MSAATVDRLLALLLALLLGTGLLTLRIGTPSGAPLFVVHGLFGGALVVLLALKLRVSLPNAVRMRRWGRIALSATVALLALASLGGGFVWVASGRILALGPWTILTLHVWAALALAPLLLAHLLPHRWRLLQPRRRRQRIGGAHGLLTRRALLVSAALAVAGASGWIAANVLDVALGGRRRFTGSRPLPPGGVPPVTTFFGEATPVLDPSAWRLRVSGKVAHPYEVGLRELLALPAAETEATLDCTSGWAMTTRWQGVPMSSLLEAASVRSAARSVTVRSVTGWSTTLDLGDAQRALLATTVAGEPLPAGNGAPCRLVVPDHRGLDWVKWVTDVEVT